LTLELFRVEVRNIAALVVALVDDDAIFVELRVEGLIELDDAFDRGVGHVHVTDAAAGRVFDFFAIGVEPVDVARAGIIAHGFGHDFPGAFCGRLAVDFE